ncbi:hypothetical protein, partial [Pseudomonas aeruginosa]|uniref:hypothetical protein n=1 Tax=Pseudomonas aeruginosa TaxID=287 RepID=UPI001ABC7BF0
NRGSQRALEGKTMNTKLNATKTKKVKAVVAQTGVTEAEAVEALEAEEWLESEAVFNLRAEFNANMRKRNEERGLL